MNAWTMYYPDEFSTEDVMDYAAFVYLIQFPESGEYYVGVKQVWKGVKNYTEVKESSSESNWITYTSSSRKVQNYIAEGQKYSKQILWCFKSLQEASVLETALIAVLGTDWNCLNKAIMVKTRMKKDNGDQFRVLQRIMGDLT